MTRRLRPLLWIASSKRDFLKFPSDVQDGFGYELYLAQTGAHSPHAKPLKGPGGGVIELAIEFEGDAYRTVYAVRFARATYVLHAFKKKSKRGAATARADIELVRSRLADAAYDYQERFGQESAE